MNPHTHQCSDIPASAVPFLPLSVQKILHSLFWLFCAASLVTACFASIPDNFRRAAVISDPDGFTNVRKAPNSEAEIAFKIAKDEFFACEPSSEEWWPVRNFFGGEGYMHSSRIRLVKDLTKAEVERLFINPPRAKTDEFVGIFKLNEELLFGPQRYEPRTLPENITTSWGDVLIYNDSLRQGICLARGTDGRLPVMLMFANTQVPDEIIKEIQVQEEKKHGGSTLAPVDKKRRLWNHIIAAAPRIPEDHFRTVRGLRIGDSVGKAVKLYGEPHDRRRNNDIEILEWAFASPYSYSFVFDDAEEVFRTHAGDAPYTSSSKVTLSEQEWENVRDRLENESREPINEALRTRGATIAPNDESGGFGIRLFVRNGRLIGILFERPTI